MAPRKPAAPPPVVYVSPDADALIAKNASLSALVDDLRAQVATFARDTVAHEAVAREYAALKHRVAGGCVSRAEYEECDGQRMRALDMFRTCDAERLALSREVHELRDRVSELEAAVAPSDPSFDYYSEDPEPVAPVVHLVPATVAPEVQPCTRAEDAPAAYKRAREALESKDPAALRQALAGLPVWPSKKNDALKAELSAALRIAA